MNGGKTVRSEEMRFVVSLRMRMVHFCGGYFISEHHILTAAQCVINIDENGGRNFIFATVLVGTIDSRGGTDYRIRNTDYFRGYNSDFPAESRMLSIGMILVGSLIPFNY